MAKDEKKLKNEEKLFGKYATVKDEEIRKGRNNHMGRPGGPGGMRGRLFGEKPKNTKDTLKRILSYLGRNKTYMFLLFLIMIITSTLSIIGPVLQGKAIDAIPLRQEIVLTIDREGYLVVNEKRIDNDAIVEKENLPLIINSLEISLSSDNHWVINQNLTNSIGYNKNNSAPSVIKINQEGFLLIGEELTTYQLFEGRINKNIEIRIADSGKWIVNDQILKTYATGSKDQNTLFIILGILLVVYIVNAIFTLASNLVSNRLSESTIRKLRKDLFDNLVFLPIKYFDTHQHGDIMSRMSNDASSIANTISQSISSLISAVITIIGAVCVMIYYSPLLTLTCLVTLGLTLLSTKVLSKYMRKYFRIERSLIGEINAQVEEMVVGHKTVKAFCKEEDIEKEFNQTSTNLRKYGFRANLFGGVMGPMMNIINNIGYLLVVVFGALFVQYGIGRGLSGEILTIGTIITFTNLSKQFARPINTIANLYAQIQTSLAAAERVFLVMDEKHEINDGKILLEDIAEVGKIKFENVSFSYVENEKVLKNFNLEIEPGQKIALVGATGSGKTTIVNLLMRFYEIDEGRITIGGIDIRDIDKSSLRRNLAIVLQDTILFNDTVLNNIRYGRLDASVEEVKRSGKISNSRYFIERLPEKYNTVLTESGGNLSGGQRQLLSIARAVLAEPKILILDEATSSVDTRTEKNIQDGMVQLMKNRTSVIIAHRLSTIRDADKIVVIDHGQIAEIGRHEELLEKEGIYYKLYQTQFAGNAI